MAIKKEEFFNIKCLSLTFLIPIWIFVACGGNSGTETDGGVDYIDAFVFDCPESLENDRLCLKGEIRDFMTEDVINIGPDKTIVLYRSTDPNRLPFEEYKRVPVKDDGTFVFPSVESQWSAGPSCWYGDCVEEAEPQPFDLEIGGDPVPGYVPVTNKYGVLRIYAENGPNRFKLIFYMIPETATDTWTNNVYGYPPCDGIEPFEDNYKIVLLLDQRCIFGGWDYPQFMDFGNPMFTSQWDTNEQLRCSFIMMEDRERIVYTSADTNFPEDFNSLSAYLISIYSDMPSIEDRICFCSEYGCIDTEAEGCGFTSIGHSMRDRSKKYVVMHRRSPNGCKDINWP
jgi:hypothetical protein